MVENTPKYLEKPGRKNTEIVLKLAKQYVKRKKIKNIVVASTTGETGVKVSKTFKDLNVVVVTHHFGFRQPNISELTENNHKKILANGANILTATHNLSGIERAIHKKFETIMPLEIIAHTLRLFGEGTKVCIEIVTMAVDSGLIPEEKEVIALAGTGRGLDTALIIKSASASRFFNLEVREIITKPRRRNN